MRARVAGRRRRASAGRSKFLLAALVVAVLLIGGFTAYKLLAGGAADGNDVFALQFDSSVTNAEQQTIRAAVSKQAGHKSPVTVRVETLLTVSDPARVVAAYVPVAGAYDVRQQVTRDELKDLDLLVAAGLDRDVRAPMAAALGVHVAKLVDMGGAIPDGMVAFIPADQLTPQVKLLAFEGNYYLDSFDKGAVFRQVVFDGSGAASLSGVKFNDYADKNTTLKINMTGVTALTRTMQTKLNAVKDAAYFSEKIGPFLADADITHVSNEVSFKQGCTYNLTSFCSPPQMIDVLKASGVDLVELTGNHNNDAGSRYNTETINLYHGLGWHTFGGGLNADEAAKPYIAEQKGSKVAFLGYNYADGPYSGAIATSRIAGANHFDIDRVAADIAAAKQRADYVIVDIQFWECQAYPDGFMEYPVCDAPIPKQKEVFRQVIDLGADMVIGTQAHQPQTYELYQGKPIYYGLGNLYFDQTQWPGTERGVILTHYFVGGELVQTKLTPTVYGKELQTRVSGDDEALFLLRRLKAAREAAGL